MTKTADELRRLPYRREVDRLEEEDGIYFVAYIAEIPSIRVYGDSDHEARHLLEETFVDMLEAMVEAGDEVPRPAEWPENLGNPQSSSGRWAGGRGSKKVTYMSPEDAPAYSSLDEIEQERRLVPA